jgi:hypothetical protein
VQLKYLLYVLASSLLGSIMWESLSFYFLQSGQVPQSVLWWYSTVAFLNGHFFSLDNGSVLIPVFVIRFLMITIAAFVGLWIIGRIRKPSFFWAIPFGLTTYGMVLLIGVLITMTIAGNLGSSVVEQYFASLVHRNIPFDVRTLTDDLYASVITSIIGGLAAIILVRWRSPLFCPYCGSKLNPGCEPCKKCGKKPSI